MYALQIVSCCHGEAFERYATRFVAAINHNSPGQLIQIHVLNPLDTFSEQAAFLQQSARAVTLQISSETKSAATEPKTLQEYRYGNRCDVLFLCIHSLVKKDLLIFLNQFHDRAARTKTINLSDASRMDKRFVSHLWQDDSVIWSHPEANDQNEAALYGQNMCLTFAKKASIAIITRRVDLPFKTGIRSSREGAIRRVHDTTRLYWQYFPKILRDAYADSDETAEIICLPHDDMTPDFIKNLPHRIIYLPHGNRFQFQDQRIMFYMQEMYPFFFTLDPNGWGATSSRYGQSGNLSLASCEQAEQFCHEIKSKKTSKYRQQAASLPEFDVFFPLQIPDDESLQFGSTHSLYEIVHAVIQWAEQHKIRVLFKCHPIKPSLRYLRIKTRSPYVTFIKTGDIHDLLARAKVVFVANSGVGFEALLYFKPVVAFARAIYDTVVIKSDLDGASIQKAYQTAMVENNLDKRYLPFIQWYIFETGCLIKNPSTHIPCLQKTIVTQGYCNELAFYKNLSQFRRHLNPFFSLVLRIKKRFANMLAS